MTHEQTLEIVARYCRNRWALQSLQNRPYAFMRETRMTLLRAKIKVDEKNYPRCRFIYAACYLQVLEQ